MIPERYLEKVYSGFLGMNIGIRLGAPVEPSIWTYERIRDTYGDIAGYTLSFEKQRKEFGTVTPFAVNHGAWTLEDGQLSLMRCEPSFAYAGNYYAADYAARRAGDAAQRENHLLVIRAQGAMRGYAGGLGEHGKAVLYKNDFGFRKLAETDFPWETGKTYNICLQARGNEITLFLDGEPLLTAQDSSFAYGMYGCGSLTMGRTLFSSFSIS